MVLLDKLLPKLRREGHKVVGRSIGRSDDTDGSIEGFVFGCTLNGVWLSSQPTTDSSLAEGRDDCCSSWNEENEP